MTVEADRVRGLTAGMVVVGALMWSSASGAALAVVDHPEILSESDAPASVVFSDVPSGHRFYDAITWAAAEGITTGFGDGTFRPTEAVSRQAMVSFLHRLAGEPATGEGVRFSDVPSEHRFYDAITWAAAEGITDGYPDGSFRPTEAVSRQASAAFLHRFAGEPSLTTPAGFLDIPPGHQFHDAIAWAVDASVTTGYYDGYFRPRRAVTRQAAAAFIYRAETGAGTAQPDPHPDIIDTSDRSAVERAFAHSNELMNTPTRWTGSSETCDAGGISNASKSAALQLVNYHRALAGLPPIRITTEWDAELQAAALVVSRGGGLTHNPEPTRPCYTDLGALGAATSNLSTGGPTTAVSTFMTDAGDNNRAVGHRRWLLWPQAGVMGVGATDMVVSLRVRAGKEELRPTHPEWVAWPPQGYIPWPDMPLSWFQQHFHWSLSSNADPDADFSAAKVYMTMDGEPLDVTVYDPERRLDNTLVWNVQREGDRLFDRGRDVEFVVKVDGILMSDGQVRSHTYRVSALGL